MELPKTVGSLTRDANEMVAVSLIVSPLVSLTNTEEDAAVIAEGIKIMSALVSEIIPVVNGMVITSLGLRVVPVGMVRLR